MKIYVPQKRGFCFGVEKAIIRTEEELEKGDEVYCLGDLIHNPRVMDKLRQKGLKVISDLSKIKKGTVITRAHGVNQALVNEAQEKGIKIVETTCPYVLRVQKIARSLVEQSYTIVVVGSAEHPEIKSLIANVSAGKVYVVKNPHEVLRVPGKKIGVVAQTTESLDNFKNIVKNLIKSRLEIRVFNTICRVVDERREEIKSLANKVDTMIVVGGYHSSNTSKLAKLCEELGMRTFFVEKKEDINFREMKKLNNIGITGGTSTPEKTIKEIYNMLCDVNKKSVKEGR